MMGMNNTLTDSQSVEILYIVKRTREINKLLAIQENHGKIELTEEMNALKSRSAALVKLLQEKEKIEDKENNDSGQQEEDLQTKRKCKFMGFFGFLKKKDSA